MNHVVTILDERAGESPFEELITRAALTVLACQGVNVPCEVDVLLTDDGGIREINFEQRGLDEPTDVLSFPMFDLTPGCPPGPENADPETGRVPLGDIVLSVERAEAQAAEYGHSAERETAYLTVHSVLHLLGYDHTDEREQKAKMRAEEDAALAALGLIRGE